MAGLDCRASGSRAAWPIGVPRHSAPMETSAPASSVRFSWQTAHAPEAAKYRPRSVGSGAPLSTPADGADVGVKDGVAVGGGVRVGRTGPGVAVGDGAAVQAASSRKARISAGRGIGFTPRSDAERAVLVNQLAVDPDLRIAAHLDQHIPVDGRTIVGAGIRVAGAAGQVDRPTDPLVPQD